VLSDNMAIKKAAAMTRMAIIVVTAVTVVSYLVLLSIQGISLSNKILLIRLGQARHK